MPQPNFTHTPAFACFHLTPPNQGTAQTYWAFFQIMAATIRRTCPAAEIHLLTNSLSEVPAKLNCDHIFRFQTDRSQKECFDRLMVEEVACWQTYFSSDLFAGPTVLIDVDLLVQKNPFPLFDAGFDIGLTYTDSPDLHTFNSGVILVDPARRAVQELGVSTLHFRLRGRAHVEGGRFAQALPLLALAREGAPEDAGLLRLQARALAETGRGEVALDALAASLELDPDSVEAHLLAGRLQESLGRHDEAALAYARAIDLEPRAGEAYVLRANALARAGRGREAAAVYERAAVHGVGGADLQKNWGTVLHGLGDVPGALARYERAVELAPEDADAHGNLRAILEELGRTDEALRHYRRAVELQADHPARERLERLGG